MKEAIRFIEFITLNKRLLIKVSQPAFLRQTGIGVYAWGVRTRLGGDTSTGRDLTAH